MQRPQRRIYPLCLGLLLSVAGSVAAVEKTVLPVGETLTYKVGWKAASAGTVQLRVVERGQRQGRPTWRIQGTAETNAVIDKVFTVRDRFDSWVDVRAPQTLSYARYIREGPTQKDEFVTLDPVRKRWQRRRYDLDESKNIKLSDGPLPAGPVVDALGALYVLRQLPLDRVTDPELTVFENGKTVALRLARRGTETLKTSAGEFRCIRFEPLFKKDGRWTAHPKATLFLWVTDTPQRWLVKMEGSFTFGFLQVLLDNVKIGT